MFTKTKYDIDAIEVIYNGFKDEERHSFLSVYLWVARFLIPQELLLGKNVPRWVFGLFFKNILWSIVISPVVLFHWTRHIISRLLWRKDIFTEFGEEKYVEEEDFFPFYAVPINGKDYIFIPIHQQKEAEA